MSKSANTHSLSNYTKCPISLSKNEIKNATQDKVMYFNYVYDGKSYNYTVNLVKTPCHYGGYRYWYLCPHCGRRVGVLYKAGLYVCRHCIGASYQTQLNQPLDNIRRKIHKVASKLDWHIVGYKEIPTLPKGMHLKTYVMIYTQYRELEKRENLACMASFKSFCKRRGLRYE